MTDASDLEAGLAELDRRLRELQRELAAVAGPTPQLPPKPPPAVHPPPPSQPPRNRPSQRAEAEAAIEEAVTRVAELGRRLDQLQSMRRELERATDALLRELRGQTAASQTRGRAADTSP